MFSMTTSGSFDKTEAFLRKVSQRQTLISILDKYGAMGASALAGATPVEDGLTAASWTYSITQGQAGYSIVWRNTNTVDGTPVAILLQVGHGTGSGGYVQGRDFINPAIKPVMDQIATDVWKAVTSA